MTKKLAIQISIGVLIIIVILVVMAALIGKRQVKNAPGNVVPPGKTRACTEEAKLCPDGTSVGRTGPNCDFAPCPNMINEKNIISCKANDDCIVTFTAENSCCSGCTPEIINRQIFNKREQWKKKNCANVDCGWQEPCPQNDYFIAACKNNICNYQTVF